MTKPVQDSSRRAAPSACTVDTEGSPDPAASGEPIRRIGILTGGGDAPGLNAVIRAVTRTAIWSYHLEVVGVLDGFAGLLEERYRPLSGADVREIHALGGTILGTTNRVSPYAVPGPDGPEDHSERAIANARRAGLDALVVIGGDGTLHIACKLASQGLRVVGVPKTIDNDLDTTDFTFGFWTAIETATDALDRLRDTAESHHRVMILEVMGRDAGWIALHAGLAGGADVILIPEIPYRPEAVAAKVEERRSRDQAFSLVVVAEGAVPVGGDPSIKGYDPLGHPKLGGAGERLLAELSELIDPEIHEIRVTVLGHLQRGGSPIAFDRILATRFGEQAVHVLMAGRESRMVRLRGTRVEDVPMVEAVREIKGVDPDGALVRTARCTGTGFGDEVERPPMSAAPAGAEGDAGTDRG